MRTPIRVTSRFAHIFVEAMSGTSLATAAPPQWYPVGASAVRTKGAKAQAEHPYKPREDFRGHPAAGTDIIKLHKAANADFDGYSIPSGSIGTAPDIGPAMKAGGWDEHNPGGNTTIAASPASTVTSLQVADASGISAKDIVLVNGEVAYVVTSDGNTPGVLTVWPPLTSAPSSGNDVKTACYYVPSNTRDVTEQSLAAWIGSNRTQMRVLGWVPEKWVWDFGGDDAGNCTVEGAAREAQRITGCLLNGSINNSTVTITVDDANIVPDDVSATRPVSLTIEADGTNAEEHVICTAKSGNDLTVTRGAHGSSGVAHDDDSVIRPFFPAETIAGTPVPSILGSVCIGSTSDTARTEYQLKSAQVDADLAVNKKEDVLGEQWKLQGYSLGMRNIAISLEGWADDATQLLSRQAEDMETASVLVQQGDTEGSIVGFFCLNALFDNPADDPSADEMGVSLSGRALHASADSDTDPREVVIFFA